MSDRCWPRSPRTRRGSSGADGSDLRGRRPCGTVGPCPRAILIFRSVRRRSHAYASRPERMTTSYRFPDYAKASSLRASGSASDRSSAESIAAAINAARPRLRSRPRSTTRTPTRSTRPAHYSPTRTVRVRSTSPTTRGEDRIHRALRSRPPLRRVHHCGCPRGRARSQRFAHWQSARPPPRRGCDRAVGHRAFGALATTLSGVSQRLRRRWRTSHGSRAAGALLSRVGQLRCALRAIPCAQQRCRSAAQSAPAVTAARRTFGFAPLLGVHRVRGTRRG